MRWLLVFAALAIGLGSFAAMHRATGTVTYSRYSAAIETARLHRYRPMSTDLRPNETPWIFDGKSPVRGVVLETWSADTAPNRRACDKEWTEEDPYIGFCRTLSDTRIAAVLLTEIDGESLAYVPVNRISSLHRGDKVIIRTGEVDFNGKIGKLPSLFNVVQWGPGSLNETQD